MNELVNLLRFITPKIASGVAGPGAAAEFFKKTVGM